MEIADELGRLPETRARGGGGGGISPEGPNLIRLGLGRCPDAETGFRILAKDPR